MTDPIVTGQRQTIGPVQAGEEEERHDRWAFRLVMFLRVMAAISLGKGLYHWSIVCGFYSPLSVNFEDASTPFQSATVFFGVIDLVAAVGLWLAAPWGAVVWLTSSVSMIVVEILLPQIYGDLWLVFVTESVMFVVYFGLAGKAAASGATYILIGW